MWKKFKPVIIVIVLVFMVAMIFVGCGGPVDTSDSPNSEEPSNSQEAADSTASNDAGQDAAGKLKIGLSTFTLEVTWQSQNIGNVEAYVADRYTDKMDFQVFNANGKTADQVTQIENMISDGYDAILVDSSSPTGLNNVLKKARSQGIVVINYNSQVEDPEAYDVKFYQDNTEWGAVLADWLCKALDGKGKIVCLNGFSGNTLSSDRWEGAQEVFSQYPDIEILADANADWAQAPAEATMTTWLTAFPEIDGVWSQGGAMTIGCINAFKNVGRPLVPMTGEDINGFLKAWKENQADGFSSIAPGADTRWGCLALEAALRVLDGQELESVYKLGLPAITDDTLDNYVQMDGADDLWVIDQLVLDNIEAIWPDYQEWTVDKINNK